MRPILLALLVMAARALAAEAHCHTSKHGLLQDDPSATHRSACKDKGGVWLNHDASHCHATGDGVTQEFPQKTSEAQCKKADGRWFSHGHDKL